MDEGDLKRLREVCDSGSNGGTTPSLRWADYLWLDLVENLSKAEPEVESIFEVVMTDTRGDGSSLSFWGTSESPLPPLPTGHHPYSIAFDHIGGVVELKIMETDLHEKLAATHMRGGQMEQASSQEAGKTRPCWKSR